MTRPAISLETGAGDVKLIGVSGRLSARVGSGSIDAAGTPTQAWRLHSGAGNVTLRLPADTGFELDASTGIGAIATSHPLMTSGEVDNRTLRGEGEKIRCQTDEGEKIRCAAETP